MGRHEKIVLTEDGIDRRKHGYYATPKFVTDFITCEMMLLNPKGLSVLDPCVGREEMVGAFHQADKSIDGFDIQDFGVHQMANFEKKDFLELYSDRVNKCILTQTPDLQYDYYIANPPYNCHETSYIRANKKRLQKLFPEIGAANMYAMFISAMINLAKPHAVLGIITNDSFITSRLHKGLRHQILRSCRITHLLLCPVDLFWGQKADVRTCIIILVKERSANDYNLSVLNRPDNTEEFKNLLAHRDFDRVHIRDITLSSPEDAQEFVIGCPSDIRKLFDSRRLGKLFRCVTGISTGNDAKYLREVPDEYHCIPFFKNPGTRRFYMEPDAYLPKDFLEIADRVPNFIVRNKDILFKAGIACSSMGIPFGACALPAGSTFGVNANIFCDEKDKYWLLGYLNSTLVTFFVRGILLRTNMITSGYVSRIPIVPISTEGRKRIAFLAKNAEEQKIPSSDYDDLIEQIDEVVFAESGLGKESVSLTKEFQQNLLRRT